MRNRTRVALAFVALAGLAGTTATAQEQGNRNDRGRGMDRFERLDADSSGDVTFEEFAEMMNRRVTEADANGDDKMTVEEIADHIQRQRALRRAERLIERFDVNGDGELTTEEVRSRQEKRFALLDKNEDGKLTEDEAPRRWDRERRRRGRDRD